MSLYMHITDIYIRRMYVYVYTKVLTHISRYSCVCVCVYQTQIYMHKQTHVYVHAQDYFGGFWAGGRILFYSELS